MEGEAGGGGGGAGAPFPGTRVGIELITLPGGGFSGGIPAMPGFKGAEFPADMTPAPAAVPIGISMSPTILL